MPKSEFDEPVLQVDIAGLKKVISGKVRDVYDLGGSLLLVASDRISAFDVIMPNGIPDKGRVLTQLARFWFLTLRPIAVTHFISGDDEFVARSIQNTVGALTPAM